MIDQALEEGMRVIMPDFIAEPFVERYPDYAIEGPPQRPFLTVDIVRKQSG